MNKSHQNKTDSISKLITMLIACLLCVQQLSAQATWQKTTMPTLNEVWANLKNPPSQYSTTVTWGWDGNMSREVIARDLDKLHEVGFRAVTIEPGYGMAGKYLSEAWFQSIKMAVEEAKKRGMHIWIIDEGKYPSGFAGGKFSEERPDLKMQALVVEQRIHFPFNSNVDYKFGPTVLGAIAVSTIDKTTKNIPITTGRLDWTPQDNTWDVWIVGSQFKTSPTRSANNPTKGKDGSASLMDYLNPEATKQFLDWTEEQYKKYIGDEFGKTLLGFRGDEPAFSYTPWTPKMLEIFKAKKGYDIQPYLASFFVPNPTSYQQRAKADYYDVWSDLFGENYFKQEGDWCKANGLEYMVHLDKDDNMGQFVRSGGDFFKDMKDVQIPGVDAIWHQIWSDTVSNFPKFASSVSHVYSKPRALSETFAAYRPAPFDEQAKWVLNQEMVRGINLFELMFVSSSSRSGQTNLRGYMGEDAFPALVKYTNQVCYLLAQGRSATHVAFYLPTTSLWLGNKAANESTIRIGEQLLNAQRDFDFVSEQALTKDLTLTKLGFTTAAGTVYPVIVFPSISVLSNAVIEKIRTLSRYGGRILFTGETPAILTDNSLLYAQPTPLDNFSLAHVDMSGDVDFRAIFSKWLGGSDVTLAAANPTIKYTHRVLKDADVYFFFNESVKDEVNTTANLIGEGIVSEWDPTTNQLNTQNDKANDDVAHVNLDLKPQQTKFIIISKTPIKPL